MKISIIGSSALALLAFFAAAQESETKFDPFKLLPEYFDDAEVSHNKEFEDEHTGMVYRVRILSSSKGLETKHEGRWVKHGVHHEFYSSGKLSAKKNYVLGKLHGEVVYYFTNGNVKRRYYYENGLKHGSWEDRFEKAGTVWHEGTYVKGKKQGPEKVYYSDGQLQFDKNYLDDKLHGTRVQYTESGKVFGREQFENGKKIKN